MKYGIFDLKVGQAVHIFHNHCVLNGTITEIDPLGQYRVRMDHTGSVVWWPVTSVRAVETFTVGQTVMVKMGEEELRGQVLAIGCNSAADGMVKVLFHKSSFNGWFHPSDVSPRRKGDKDAQAVTKGRWA